MIPRNLILGLLLLVAVSGCASVTDGYMSKDEAAGWEWGGDPSELGSCYYKYVQAVNNSGGFGYKGKAIMAGETLDMPAPCKQVFEWCIQTEVCSFQTDHSWGCGSPFCEKDLWYVQTEGNCICTLDDLDEGENWFTKKS